MPTNNSENLLLKWQRTALRRPELNFVQDIIKAGGEVYLVGGMVRDLLLKIDSKDYDFVVRNVSLPNLKKILAKKGKVNLVGKRFGVIKFKPTKSVADIDIALPRTESPVGGRGGYRDFKVQSNAKLPITDDLGRRDFTINAMAWNLGDKVLIDPHNGLADLKKKTIRTVGAPETRFREDYSRLLRAVRFASQIDFKIEAKTWRSLKRLVKHLNDEWDKEYVVSREIVGRELLRTLQANPVQGLELLEKSGILFTLIPETKKMIGCPQPKNWHAEGDVWVHTKLLFSRLETQLFKKRFKDSSWNPELLIAMLLHDLGKPYTIKTPAQGADRIRFNEHDVVGAKMTNEICRRLRFDSAPEFSFRTDGVTNMVAKHMILVNGSHMKDTTLEKYFYRDKTWGENFHKLLVLDAISTVPESGRPSLKLINDLQKRLSRLDKLSKKKELPPSLLSGHEIMKKLKIKSGPEIGRLLNTLREAQLKGKIKTKAAAVSLIQKQTKKLKKKK